jgi:hypothetical protein
MATTYKLLGRKEFAGDDGLKTTSANDLAFTAGTGVAGQPVVVGSDGNVSLPGDLTVTGEIGGLADVNTGITAFATGGQGSATALTGRYNNITTCATAGDSVALWTAASGKVQTVKNSGAATCAVFPPTGDSINALAVNLSIDLPVGAEITFVPISATVFETRESLYIPAPTTQTGGLEIKATDSAGNFTGTLTNASLGQATVWSIPDPGAGTANVVLDAGASTLAGARTFSSALITSANVGTPGTNCTAVEYGDGYNHVTVLTLTAAELTPTIPADAEGAGAIIYTLPAGVYLAHACHMDITAGVMDTATNAADLGVGSLIASGDIATLNAGDADMEDWVTGQTVADVSTFVKEKTTIMTGGASEVFETGDSHVVHINVAGTWNQTVSTASVTGTVTLYWTFLGA